MPSISEVPERYPGRCFSFTEEKGGQRDQKKKSTIYGEEENPGGSYGQKNSQTRKKA